VRRTIIQAVLPLFFCLLPALAAVLVAIAVPPAAQQFYLDCLLHKYREHTVDWLIVGIGGTLFLMQTILAWKAMQWRGHSFDERTDRWLSNLAQASEWFPLLGLIGTVAGIMQTFTQVKGGTTQAEIIRLYAPAITATGSGLFMALFNILPAWVVTLGRELILALSGGGPPKSGEMRP
jgi:hypothetical protein